MLDQQTHPEQASDMKLHPELADADWCVGDAPSRWDVSFSDRLWLTLRRWFARHAASNDPVTTLRVTPTVDAVECERRQAA
jgi:hypothetical protein